MEAIKVNKETQVEMKRVRKLCLNPKYATFKVLGPSSAEGQTSNILNGSLYFSYFN